MASELPGMSRRAALLGGAALVASRVAQAQADLGSSAGSAPAAPAGRPSRAGGAQRFDVDRFIDDCRRANRERDSQSAVREVLERGMRDPAAVLNALGAPARAGIATLHRSPDLTILNIVWAPLMQLMPHEHNMWALIGIYTGREDNIFWRRRDGRIVAREAAALAEGMAVPLPSDVIHSVANPIARFTGAIHVYGGDFFTMPRSEWDPDTLGERPWDIDNAVRLFRESNERFLAWDEAARCA